MAGGSGQDRRDDDLHGDQPAFSDEAMRRIVYGEDRGSARDSRSAAFAQDTEELEADLRERRSLVPAVTALAALFCFGAIVWYAYTWGTGQMASEDLPVVLAEPMPEKVKPEQPGGMEVPHQGIAVLNEGESGQGAAKVERLLPPPEEPAPPAVVQPPAPQTVLEGGEDTLPEPPGEAPLIAALPETAPEGGTPPEAEAAEVAEAAIAKPIRKPETGDEEDQIAALLEQEPLETGNGEPSEAAPPSPPTQTAALTPGSVVLQLASVTSEGAASREWARLQRAQPDLLGSLDLALDTAEVQGTTYYRVQTGPFPSRAAAADLCAQLKARNQDCLVTTR